jgi:peptidoglycan hydrolase-like protein with peptidoglycan-binding domain
LNNDTPGTDDGAAWGIADGIVPGVHVEAGQHIGWVGDSGNAENTGSHLHFELFDPAGVVVNSYNALLAVCGSRCTQTGSASTGQTSTSQTSTAIAGPNDTLIYGSRGSVVSDLQSTLKSLGFNPGPVDGIFGGLTLTAVEAFQLARGLTVDGKVGPATKGALASSPTASGSATSDPGSVVAYGINGSNVVDLQTMLARLGHNPGPIDGAFGPLTLGAVRTFQTSVGLSGTGTVDQATWDTLVSAAGSGSDAPTLVVAYGARGSQVFDLQTRLDALGHGPGPIDGIFGPKTRGAVTAFQGVADLTANGIVDQATWDALVAAGG